MSAPRVSFYDERRIEWPLGYCVGIAVAEHRYIGWPESVAKGVVCALLVYVALSLMAGWRPFRLPRVAKWIDRARVTIGAKIIGGDLYASLGLLALIKQRAQQAVTPDGRVSLADCKPLADVLYAETPGIWSVTMTRTDPFPPSSEDKTHAD